MRFIYYNDNWLNASIPQFDPLLIILSIVAVCVSSFCAFRIVDRMERSGSQAWRLIWMLSAATILGLGIWSQQCLALLALSLPFPIHYSLQLTLSVLGLTLLFNLLVFGLLTKGGYHSGKSMLCGILFGLALMISVTAGIGSLQIQADILYPNSEFTLAAIIVSSLSGYAFFIQFKPLQSSPEPLLPTHIKTASALSTAACAALYIPLSATRFEYNALKQLSTQAIHVQFLAYLIAVALISLAFLCLHTLWSIRNHRASLEIKQKDEALRIAETVFQAHDAIIITDQSTRIISVNPAFSTITGFTEQEAIGRTPKLIQSGKHNKLFFKELWEALLHDQSWCGEIWNKRKDGDLFPCWQTISTVKNALGEITHYVSFFSDISKFKENEQAIERLAFYDPLTDLPNRRLLEDHLAHEFQTAKRYHRYGALLFLDLDRFKLINDSLGHSVGDEILKMTAKRLQNILRQSDIPVRLGGDEYIVLIPAQNKKLKEMASQAQSVAEKIIKAINEPYMIDEQELFLSTSIGISQFSGNEESPEIIMKQADTAMYQAKEAGRNTFRFYKDSMQKQADFRLQLEKNLRQACFNEELDLHYQAQLSSHREIIGAEALVRWQHPELGMIPPADFIPIAEETGLIVDIGAWVLKTVCEKIQALDLQGINIPHVAVNISLRQFHQANFSSMVKDTVANAGIQPERVLLEITESVFLKNVEDTVAIMEDLKASGFRFSIDDFGTGYASLSFLKRLPFDQLKIDQSFIRDLMHDSDHASSAIVRAIIAMAQSMGLNLIAEGVETEQQLAFLNHYGCYCYQGYHFSRPLSFQSFQAFCQEHPVSSEHQASE